MRKRTECSSLIQTQSGYWYFHAYDVDGKRRSISTRTQDRKEAEKILKEFQRFHIVQIDNRKTLRACLSEFSDKDSNPRYQEAKITGRLYGSLHAINTATLSRRLLEILPNIYLSKHIKDITRIDCISIRKIIWQQYGSTSVAYNTWKKFKTILSYCAKDGYITQSPATGLENINYEKKKKLALPADDIKAIMEEKSLFLSEEYRTFFIVLATTGMRRGEAAALCTAQYKEIRGIRQICIDRARKDEKWSVIGLPKMNIVRTIPIADITCKAIEPYLNPENPYDLLFPNITRSGLLRCFDMIRATAPAMLDLIAPEAVQEISPHILRHSLNTELVLTNLNNLLVQEYLSWHHQDLGTQEGYTHIYARNMKPVADMIDAIYGDGGSIREFPIGNAANSRNFI